MKICIIENEKCLFVQNYEGIFFFSFTSDDFIAEVTELIHDQKRFILMSKLFLIDFLIFNGFRKIKEFVVKSEANGDYLLLSALFKIQFLSYELRTSKIELYLSKL